MLVAVPALAFAEPAALAPTPSLALRWSDASNLAPATAYDFESRLSERLGHRAFDEAVTDQALAVTWQGSPEHCQVELALLHGDQVEGTRLLESPSDCRALLPALLTVAALLIESQASEPVPEAPKPRASAPEPPSPLASSPPPARYPVPETQPSLLLSLGAELSSGLAPRLELGPAASLAYAPIRYLRLGAQGSLFLRHQYGAAPGFSLGHDSGRLFACGMPLSGGLGLGLCGNAAFHRFTSTGISLPHPQAHHSSSWTAGVALRGEWRLVPHLWWVGSVGADISTEPLYFYFTPAAGGASILFRQQRVAPSLFLGLTFEP
jgi:hypothetical protein